jgi:hypothetical protein
MKRRLVIAAIISLFETAAFAQQPLDSAFMQNALTALQAQRNGALDQEAVCEANGKKVADTLKTAQDRVKELEDKYEPKKPPKVDK